MLGTIDSFSYEKKLSFLSMQNIFIVPAVQNLYLGNEMKIFLIFTVISENLLGTDLELTNQTQNCPSPSIGRN